MIVNGAIGAPPNSNLAESSASERVGSGAGSEKPSNRPAAATIFATLKNQIWLEIEHEKNYT